MSTLDTVKELAASGRLYPSVILHGTDDGHRRATALELAVEVLCPRGDAACRDRVTWPGSDPHLFHPDLHVLERDLRTTTSAEATKGFLRTAYRAPYEGRAQVFVIAEADTLSGEAADALLKILEEPPDRTPRHFFLLAGADRSLLPTLRSRSLVLFLGPSEPLDHELITSVAGQFGDAVERWRDTGATAYLLAAATVLGEIEGWRDARAERPWATAAAVVTRCARGMSSAPHRRALLALADALMSAGRWRLRGITHGRILEGLIARHLG